MKYLYLMVGVIFIGCSSKDITLDSPKVNKSKTTQVVTKPKKAVEEEEQIIVEEEVVVEEPKVTKNIKYDIPPSCASWSDGCNVCSRISSKKASCTTYPACHNRMISCLKWQ